METSDAVLNTVAIPNGRLYKNVEECSTFDALNAAVVCRPVEGKHSFRVANSKAALSLVRRVPLPYSLLSKLPAAHV